MTVVLYFNPTEMMAHARGVVSTGVGSVYVLVGNSVKLTSSRHACNLVYFTDSSVLDATSS